MSAVNDKEAADRTVKLYSVRDFFRRPEKHQFTISPDGRHLSFLTRHAGRQNIFVQEVGPDGSPLGDARALTNETERDVPGHAWKGNDRILFVKDFGGDENYHVLSVPIHGGEPVDLTPFDGVKASIVDDLRDDDRHILIQMNRRDPQVFDVFRVDVVTGAFTPIAENPGNIMGWMTDHAGSLRVATASDGVNTTLLYRDTETEPFRPILTTNFRETVSPLFFTFDDRRLYVLSNRGRDKTAIFEFDPQTAQEGELLFETEHVDVGGMTFSTHRRVLTAAWYVDDRLHRHFFDEWARSIHEDLARQLPGQEIAITSITRDESRAIVHASSDLSPGSIWTYDIASRHLSRLTELMPWLDPADMARMEPIHFAARDGLQINGYLTLPAGIELGQKLERPLPLIVNPHGGPWARDSWGFNPEAQLLANRGYAVLQLNFRGSTGYGRAFWEASFGQWGKTMQDDIDDGIDWLVGQGLVDPARVGIYGASYGGYAVLAGVAFTPTRYAAAVDYVGVSNLFTLLESLPPYWKPMLDMMYEMIGNPQTETGKQALHDASPLFFVDRIVTPLFVAQGANDPRVKQAESDQIVSALRERGIDVKYMLKDNEGHGFHNEENQFEFYEAMEAFLAQHLGGRSGA
ncbi:dipeptidyl aminopeptidase/acylaminoacyl peptidase [Paraburkholderia sp. BL18I3N2]|uniref:S9 family peptidase n=1 Tax=Paraburkholderia sp. BL18I3N2 TaxID=1938799 RepID=UPI000D053DC8|nr:S9 family peptidase [Paraburkholderia sp. BL18I3N2]PRX27820.1 dipeptidyl aminopeptidase/acylaminoacyl peptidase [Paraburkholderia sp. BL18I3N2]